MTGMSTDISIDAAARLQPMCGACAGPGVLQLLAHCEHKEAPYQTHRYYSRLSTSLLHKSQWQVHTTLATKMQGSAAPLHRCTAAPLHLGRPV